MSEARTSAGGERIVHAYGKEMVAKDRHRIILALMEESLVNEHGEVYVSELLSRLTGIVLDRGHNELR
jgi:hypothetical protein